MMESTNPSPTNIEEKSVRRAGFLRMVATACIHVTVFLIPVWFLPWTADVLEFNKQTLLLGLMIFICLACVVAMLMEGRIRWRRSGVHVGVAGFGLVAAISTFFSQDRYRSLIGINGQVGWALATLFGFIIFYALITELLDTRAKVQQLLLTFFASSGMVAIFGLLQILGWHPLTRFALVTASSAFNTVGTVNALAMFLTVPLVMSAASLVTNEKKKSFSSLSTLLVWLSLSLSFATIVLINFWMSWIVILIGCFVCVAGFVWQTRSVSCPMTALVLPGLLTGAAVLCLVSSPVFLPNLPTEVSPSAIHSVEIARRTLERLPVFGSGPETWAFMYARYHSLAVNASPFWNVRFEGAFSTVFVLVATMGIVGGGVWLLLILFSTVVAIKRMTMENVEDWPIMLTVFSGWATILCVAGLYSFTLSHELVFWMLLAMLACLSSANVQTWKRESHPAVAHLLALVGAIMIVGLLSLGWLLGLRFAAQIMYAKGLSAVRANQGPTMAASWFDQARHLNRFVDGYHRDFSQAELAKIQEELKNTPNQERATKVDVLVHSALEAAIQATQLSPENVENWSNLASIYQGISSFTRGADELAVKNYQEAIQREPNSPVFFTEIGKLHILRADAYQVLTSSKDQAAAADAKNQVKYELEEAERQLNEATRLKSDYAPAQYALGILDERKGQLKEAISRLEQVLKKNSQEVGVGFQLAILYYRSGEKSKALDLLEQIVAFRPEYVNARWYLSSLYEERGRYDDAIAQVKKIQDLSGSNQTLSQRVDQLMKLRDAKTDSRAKPLPEPIKF